MVNHVLDPVRDACSCIPVSLFTAVGSLHLPRFQSKSNNARVQPDCVLVASLPISVGPAREETLGVRVLVDGVYDRVQLRDRDAAVLRRCKGRRDLLRDSKRMKNATRWASCAAKTGCSIASHHESLTTSQRRGGCI